MSLSHYQVYFSSDMSKSTITFDYGRVLRNRRISLGIRNSSTPTEIYATTTIRALSSA